MTTFPEHPRQMAASSSDDIETGNVPRSSERTSTSSLAECDRIDCDSVDPAVPEMEHGYPSLTRESSHQSFRRRGTRVFKSSNVATRTRSYPLRPSRSRKSASLRDSNISDEKNKGEDPGWAAVAKAFDDYDRDIITAGKDSIDSLLVFAGLFSAVLTAFNVISYALLQEDPTDSTALILAQISQQLAALSVDGGRITSIQPPYVPPARFRVSAPHILVNILWFSSLTLALVSASIGILVKQWLQAYAAMTSSQVKEHVCIRQYRFEGLGFWKVSAIMKLLPLLLQISLLLFFVGLLTLLWTVSTPVAAVVTVLVVIWLTFWLTSIWLPALYGDCPYKSAESSIFFASIQFIKPTLYSGMRMLYMAIDTPRSLELLFRRLMGLASRSYDSWREREKDIVQKDVAGLTQRTIRCADEILMDESILEIAARSYVDSPDFDESINLLIGLFLEAAHRSEEELQWWIPDGSRRTRSLIRITMDVLADIGTPFNDAYVAHPCLGNLGQVQDTPSPMQRRETLVVVLGKYLYHFIGERIAQEIVRDILDLPLRVDFDGLSISSLRVFMMGVWDARLNGLDVEIEATNAMARSTAHEYNGHRWTPNDSDKFASLCMYAIRLVTRTPCDKIAPSSQLDPLCHFREMLVALEDFLTKIREDPTGLKHSNILLYFCEDVHELVKTHPTLMPDMQHCVRALLELHTNPHPNMPTPDCSYPGRLQEHRNTLRALCDLYDIHCPRHFRLLSRFYNVPCSPGGTRDPYNLGNIISSHASLYNQT